MNQLFSGDPRIRARINLGGSFQRDSQPADSLVRKAREQREEREQKRLQDRAGARIQAFCIGRLSAFKTRQAHRVQFDALLSTPSSASDPHELLHASRLLANSFVDGNADDLKRAGKWCRAVLIPAQGASDKTPLLFSLFSEHSWAILIRQINLILLTQATLHPTLPQAALFLEIAKICSDPASYAKWKVAPVCGETTLQYLLHRGLYGHLRNMILAIPSSSRNHPALPPAIQLALLPFKAFPSPPTIKSAPLSPPSPDRLLALTQFLSSFLTIPLLLSRTPLASLTVLAGLPLDSLVLHASSPDFSVPKAQICARPEEAAALLANVLALGSKRAGKIQSGKELSAYLNLLKTLLDSVPKAWLVEKKEEDAKGKGKVILLGDSDDEDDEGPLASAKDADGDLVMGSEDSAATIDPKTRQFFSTLTERTHLLSLLTLSTRFSSTTRPALAGFLVSLLHSLPAARDEVINTIMYGGPSGATSERGGGLLREIWRGYVRAGPLGKLLGGEPDRGSTITSALANPALESEWPLLILLAELYSRCLLTLGDDEFYGTKNPLTLDEVVGLSACLRNLTFALYWNEGLGGGGEGRVGGTRMGVEQLRNLATTLLQQIHARDSRRTFTPEGHWLMTSQFDLASFIQTVVYEDDKLDVEGVEERRASGEAGDEEDEGPRRPPMAKAAFLSKRQLAFISPRLGILNNVPFVIPFETRVAIFRQFIANDRKRLGIERHVYDRRQRHRAVVRRNHLSEDSYAHLNRLGPALKSTIEIVFIDEHGMEESGIDGGGLFKELLTSLSKEMFDTDRGLWLATAEQELYPNPHSYAREPAQLQWYTFIGRILGKALYEGILVDVRFASFFLAKWLGKQSYLDDLASLDPQLYNSLLFLKNYTGDVEADLSLDFTVTEDDFGLSRTIELIPNGADTPVTNENRLTYIVLASHYRLNGQIAKQCEAFFGGLSEIIPPRFLRLFNQSELRMLVGGVDSSIDLDDLKANTVYGGWPGDEANDTVRAFWEVVEEFDAEERCKLVKFVTSCARPPLLGFSQLNPRFALRNAGVDQTRLPTSSTCVNLLKLPEYTSKDNLRQKLHYAINSNAGFDLS